MENVVSLIVGGDFVPTVSNYDLFSNGDIKSLFGEELLDCLNKVDYRLFNLEVPLVDKRTPIEKHGPNLIAPTSTIKGISMISPSLLCLANNHILDQNLQGLMSTVELLDRKNINYIGAGENIAKANNYYIFERNNKRIGVYACAEHEFTIATDIKAGANPFDPLESLDTIVELKSKCDYVIILYHGGKEHYRYPSPYLQKVCRKMVEKGADLVVCQHSHCIGSFEEYNESTIVYGQGNFLFDLSDSEYWQTSILIKLTFGEKMAIEYIPISKAGAGVRISDGKEKEKILIDFELRSKQIMESGFIEREYSNLSELIGDHYLRTFAGLNRIMRGVDRLTNKRITKYLFREKHRKVLENIIECEAHRELILKILKEKV